MRNNIFLAFVLAGASACAARVNHPTTPAEYTCGNGMLVRDANGLKESNADRVARMDWRDDAGEHYVTWPASPTGIEASEYVVPNDPRQDVVQVVYDTTNGGSTQDWRVISRDVCTARGGYNDVLARYIKGVSLDDLARDLKLDRDEARSMVNRAMVSLQKRYYRDR